MGLDPADTGARLETIVPGQETITVYVRNPAPANDTFTAYVVTARGRPSSGKSDAAAERYLPNTEKVWHLYRPSLALAGLDSPTTPENYNYLVDAGGVKWIIRSVQAKSNWSFVILNTRMAIDV